MNKYAVIFCLPADAIKQWMETVDEATRKEQSDGVMAEWKTWVEEHKDAIVDPGLPLGKTMRVSKDGVTEAKNDLNWFMVVQAESQEAAAALIQSNPHLKMIPSSYAEVMTTGGMGGA